MTEPDRRFEHHSNQQREKLFSLAARLIGVIGTILALIFTWLQVRKGVGALVENVSSQGLVRLALIILYFCWFIGLKTELIIQKSVFLADPNHWKITRSMVVGVLVLVTMALAVLLASEYGNVRLLAIALSAFLIADVVFYQVFAIWQRPVYEASEKQYRSMGDNVSLEQMNIVRHYTSGRRWHCLRFGFMALTILLINLICFHEPTQTVVSVYLSHVLAILADISAAQLRPLVPALAILCYVVVFEIWQWYMRVRTRLFLRLLDEMKEKYEFAPRQA